MFETELISKFKKIFGLKKVSFDDPGEAEESECLFIEIQSAHNSVRDGKVVSKVEGTCSLYGPNSKIPFGYFSKCIQQALREDTKDLFFFDFESSNKRYRDKVQRGFSFIYFFSGQYDPETGTITSIDITIDEGES